MVPFEQLLDAFVTLWVVIDPIGSVPVFLAVCAGMNSKARLRTALKAILISAGILLAFIIGGQFMLEAMNISLPAFQIAGGIILFLFALSMIFGESKPESEQHLIDKKDHDVAVFPLAVPSIASPGAMLAVVILTDNSRFNATQQMATTAVMLLVLAITFVLLCASNLVHRLIGNGGASIVSRVMGMVLASVAASNVLEAISEYYGIGGGGVS